MRIDESVARGIANTSLWSAKHARTVVGIVLALTLVSGFGVSLITTNVDVADVLPRGDPNTEAAHNLTKQFRSSLTQQVTFQLHVDEVGTRWNHDNAMLIYRNQAPSSEGESESPWQASPDRLNITDEVYIRAMWELQEFIEQRTDFNRQASIAGIYGVINWTLAGGENQEGQASYNLPSYHSPDGALRYSAVDQATKAAVLSAVDALASPSWNHGAALFMPEANNDKDMRVLGEQIIAAREAYIEAVDAGDTEFTIWGSDNPPLMVVDLPVANAHSSNLVEGDMVKLMPIIAVFIIVCLYLAFRNVRAIAISFAALGVGVTWTYGTMGYMGIALNTLNMTIVPLIMGVGIDYAIHMINEFLEHKAHGRSDDEAFAEAGKRAGLAMFIATLTTVLGLIVMMVSPSLLMAQLGFLSALAISAIYILTITFIPAALTLLGGNNALSSSFAPSRAMPSIGRFVTKGRIPLFIILVLLTAGAYLSALNLEEEAFGDPGKNFPKDDEIRQQHEQGLKYFYEMEDPDVKVNILAFEGPRVLSPASIEYMLAIEENLAGKERVISDTLRTLPFFVDTWLTVKGGAPCVAAKMGSDNIPDSIRDIIEPIVTPTGENGAPCASQAQFPTTEGALRDELNAMFQSPMADLASVIINYPTLNMAAMTFSVQASTYDEAEEVWNQVWAAIDEANRQFGGHPPDGVRVAFVGNTATNYLFVAEQLPWLWYMSYTATGILFVLVLLFTRDIKATIVATLLAGVTSFWWFGLLPVMGIGLAITLMLPVVFIFNIGTDYAVHLIWNLKQVGDGREVLETTGKAILFSAITTAGAFVIFTFIQNVAVSRTMIATTLAIAVIFVSTMLVIPIFYRIRGKNEPVQPIVKAIARPKVVKAIARPKK